LSCGPNPAPNAATSVNVVGLPADVCRGQPARQPKSPSHRAFAVHEHVAPIPGQVSGGLGSDLAEPVPESPAETLRAAGRAMYVVENARIPANRRAMQQAYELPDDAMFVRISP